MLEIIAGLTLALLIAIGAAILYWYRTAERLLLDTAVGVARTEVLLKGTTKDIAAGNAMLAEALANLPKKGKPGRKPSSSSSNGTAPRRGRPPKATAAGSPSAPTGAESEPAGAGAPAVPSGALFPFPSVSNE